MITQYQLNFMNHRQILLIGFLCLINLTIPGFAREWRSIFPLQTTRGELLKLLGEPQKDQLKEGEYFKVSDGIVKIRWQRPDCYGQVTKEPAAGAASLVYQITFIPDEPLAESSIESEKKTRPEDYSEKLPKPEDYSDLSKKKRAEVKLVYKEWISQDVDCLIGADGSSCSIMGRYSGFGYSTSNKGVTALYYYPTEKESTAWKQGRPACSSDSK